MFKLFVLEYWDWSHLKERWLEDLALKFHWLRAIIFYTNWSNEKKIGICAISFFII